jgi:hypothetical protein
MIGALRAFAGAQIFKYKQSSLLGPLTPPPFGRPSVLVICKHGDANSVAERSPVHLIGRGGAQRRSPTGGKAKGTPLKTLSAPSLSPINTPEAVLVLIGAASSGALTIEQTRQPAPTKLAMMLRIELLTFNSM